MNKYEGYQKTYLDVPVEVLTPLEELSTASKKNKKNRDVIDVKFKVVHAGMNKKGDIYSEEALRDRWDTIKDKPIDWEHEEPIIGVITKAKLAKGSAEEPMYIECEGKLWKFHYPDLTELVRESVKSNGELSVSIEAWFADANYHLIDDEGNKTILSSTEASEDVKAAWGTYYDGKYVGRELVDVIFGGCGFTATPADKYAMLLAAASNRDGDMERYEYLKDIDFAYPVKRIFPIDTKMHTEASLTEFNTVIAQYTLDDNAKKAIHDKILEASNKHHLVSNVLHTCSMCEKEGGTDNMPENEPTVTLDETTEETAEEAVASEEEVPAEEEAAEEASEEEAEDAEEATASELAEIKTAVAGLAELVQKLVPAEEPAEEAQASEVNPVQKENDELKTKVQKLEEAVASLRIEKDGIKRFKTLADEGLVIEDEGDKTIAYLGSKSDEEFETYKTDLKKAYELGKTKASTTEEEAEASEEEPPEDDAAFASLNQPDEDTSESGQVNRFKKLNFLN